MLSPGSIPAFSAGLFFSTDEITKDKACPLFKNILNYIITNRVLVFYCFFIIAACKTFVKKYFLLFIDKMPQSAIVA